MKRKSYFKRAAYIMQARLRPTRASSPRCSRLTPSFPPPQTLEHEAALRALAARATPVPAFRPGDVVHVKLAVPENKRRGAEFRGLCIARRNRGLGSSFTLRSVLGNYAVERSFPLCVY